MEKSVYTHDYQVVLQLLVEARKTAGIKQVELAQRLGTTQSYVSKIERGELRLDVLQLRGICRVLGIGLVDFVARLERRLSEREDRRQKSPKRAKK
jgi:transcriptional regulator with XRE-family HTH domain